jgi:hypothetical protein
MKAAIEITKPLAAALRMSESLPNTQETGRGNLHVLYGEHYTPVGYLVEKIAVEDAWESLDPRYFITTSHADAIHLLAVPFAELPAREVEFAG